MHARLSPRAAAIAALFLLACAPAAMERPPGILPPDQRPGEPRGLSTHPAVGALVVENRTGWTVEIALLRGGLPTVLGTVEPDSRQTFQPLPANERVTFTAESLSDGRSARLADVVLHAGYPRRWTLHRGSGWSRPRS